MKKILGMFAAAAMMMAAQAASAATTFSFSFSGNATGTGNPFSGSGLLFADDGVAGPEDSVVFTVTGATGLLRLVDNSTRQITGVGILDDGAGQQSQNTIISLGSDSALVQIAFTFTNANDVALFTLDNISYVADAVIDGTAESATGVQFDVAAVPEPATWGMMLLGFALVGGAMRRRRVSVAFAA